MHGRVLLKQEVVMIAIMRYIIHDYIILFMVHYRLFIYTKLSVLD